MSSKKEKILKRLAKSASQFDADYQERFVCPACLRSIPIDRVAEITQAHILPRYSGGSLKTLLCKQCNSSFGARQDLWLGEYLHLCSSGWRVFDTRKQRRHFVVNGQRVPGEHRETDEGDLDLAVHLNRMSPAERSRFKEATRSGDMKLEVEIPVLTQTKAIVSGFLTAAYLLWFKELGYSWAFQSHLNRVRDQIAKPLDDILPTSCVVDAGGQMFEKPWIGFIEIEEEAYPCAGLADKLVILPSASRPAVHEHLASLRGKEMVLNYEAVRISDWHQFPGVTGIVYRNSLIVLPDMIRTVRDQLGVLRYVGDGSPPEWLRQVSKDEVDQIEAEYEVQKLSFRAP